MGYNKPFRLSAKTRLFICLVMLLLMISGSAKSQTFNEWFRQRKTQIRYLTQQIAHLQAQIILVKKGYDIAKENWEFISDLKDGEFSLHREYFNRQDKINTVIDDNPQKTIAEIKARIKASR